MTRNIAILLLLALVLTACGTVATPEADADNQAARIAEAATAAAETSEAPTLPPTATPTVTPTDEPTATPVPPTETPVPPTEVLPTEAPTESATVENAAETEAEEPVAEAAPAGDPALGEAIFANFYPEASFACNTCHLNNSEAMLIGPGLLNIGERAADRVEGQTAEEYLRISILNPGEYVVEGFPDMLMPQIYADLLSDEDLDNLVAYLFTLEG